MSAAINPYLNFDGNTRTAMEFYQKVLGGTLSVQTFAESGMPVSEAYQDKVMHARIDVDGIVIMASDYQEDSSPVFGDNFSLSLTGGPAERSQLTQAFEDLAAEGEVSMALQDVPWGATFGMLKDKFGVNWLVNINHAEE